MDEQWLERSHVCIAELWRVVSKIEKELCEGKLPEPLLMHDMKKIANHIEESLPYKGEEKEVRLPPKKEYSKKPLFINELSELSLEKDSGFIKQLLNLLPVQIFIKEAEVNVQKGRKYLYLNAPAIERSDMGNGIPPTYDGEAFKGGVGSSEWKNMAKDEGEVLAQLPSEPPLKRKQSWTNPHGIWRLNSVTEVPIFMQNQESAVAFCAIAEDISFMHLEQGFLAVARAQEHELGNTESTITGSIDYGIELYENGEYELAKVMFQDAKIHASQSAQRAKLFVKAAYGDSVQNNMTVSELAYRLKVLTESELFTVEIEITDDLENHTVRCSDATLAIVLELLRNARKHGTGYKYPGLDFVYKKKAILKVTSNGNGSSEWTVSNEYVGNTLEGKFNPLNERHGSRMIEQVCKNQFGRSFEEIINFPGDPENGMVNVSARIPLSQN